MTTKAAATPPSAEIASYIQFWVQALTAFCRQVGNSALSWQALEPAADATASPDDVWISAAWTGSLRGELACRLSPSSAVAFAKLLMSEPPSESPLTDEYKEAAIESLRQVAGLVAGSVRAARGETQVRVEAGNAPSWLAGATQWICAKPAAGAAIGIELQLSAALIAELRTPDAAAESHDGETPPDSADITQLHADARLDVLMDVEMETTLRFGQRQLVLREVLDLVPGSLVELDRRVEDPVDLILDGKVIARGEVVVMDGSYGLRVSEIVGKSARAASA